MCQCGVKKEVDAYSIKSGVSQSCGCLRKELATTHGMSRSKEYGIYMGILERCYNTKRRDYLFYGAIGITVSDRWKESFENFIEDMGTIPSQEHTIERVDVNKNYCKENCIWVEDNGLQSYNQRKKKNNTSGKTGVGFYSGKWYSHIGYKGETINLGYYDSFKSAVKAREDAEIFYYGFNKE